MQTEMWTRRKFLVGAAAMPLAMRGMAKGLQVGPTPKWVLLGTDTGKGIYRASWNASTGELGSIELAVESERPNFFVRHPHLPVVYTVNESTTPVGGISSFRLDAAKGGLTPINRVDSHGAGPCALGIDHTGKQLFVADYGGGAFAAYHLEADGKIGPVGGTLACQGVDAAACGPLGPVKDRQNAPHLHCAVVAPGNDFVLVCDLGDDAIEIFPLHHSGAAITSTPQRVAARTGSGPRHIAFHPSGRWFYVAHELDCTLDIYDWKVAEGKATATLRPGSVVFTLKPGTGLAGNSGCEIQVSRDGRFVYACSRGVDEITVYAVGREGDLTELQRVSSGGRIPRYFALDPTERWLACTNQGAADSGAGATVSIYHRDSATGKLSETPRVVAAPTPMFVLWV
ncbi:6-phosphogluconolactonase, cycloisomerase 2 family [Bryocella elongata]|uniref:6-phosphogluconolactonase, cycloisomerase 2 family n=1 Tax=Bryocella elongata TaxID=863522 RepID=A0A1H5W7K0_9BACT|nr:lactonase family protein [Bryocella elongata]SEF95383.1 6-phosphogluconolactonase, cycloisomerase 2 family [Bryocella elongata]